MFAKTKTLLITGLALLRHAGNGAVREHWTLRWRAESDFLGWLASVVPGISDKQKMRGPC
jgi:hypothetical protein